MMTMMKSENQSSQSQFHVTAIRSTEVLVLKSQLNRLPGFSMCGGCSVFTHHQSRDRKQMVNATLMTGHQAYYKFHILQQICSTRYFSILFWDWGRQFPATPSISKTRKDTQIISTDLDSLKYLLCAVKIWLSWLALQACTVKNLKRDHRNIFCI